MFRSLASCVADVFGLFVDGTSAHVDAGVWNPEMMKLQPGSAQLLQDVELWS